MEPILSTPEELLPHRPPMLLLTSSGAADKDTVTAQCVIGETCRLFKLPNGRYGAWILIELMAQTIGLYAGLKNRSEGSAPRVGFLLGTRQFEVHVGDLSDGDVIDLSARCVFYSDGELPCQFDCRARRNGREIAAANLTVYQPNSLNSWKN